jgi:acyl-CoA-binding protein
MVEDFLSLTSSDELVVVGIALDRPGLFAMKDRAKWDAWNSRKGLSKEDAMKAYIEKVDTLCGTTFSSEI